MEKELLVSNSCYEEHSLAGGQSVVMYLRGEHCGQYCLTFSLITRGRVYPQQVCRWYKTARGDWQIRKVCCHLEGMNATQQAGEVGQYEFQQVQRKEMSNFCAWVGITTCIHTDNRLVGKQFCRRWPRNPRGHQDEHRLKVCPHSKEGQQSLKLC